MFKNRKTKTQFSGFTYQGSVPKQYAKQIAEVSRVMCGIVTDTVHDGALVATIPQIFKTTGNIQLYLNRINTKKIIAEHGNFNAEDVIMTGNEPDYGFYYLNKNNTPEKINLVKVTPPGGLFILGANRFNGYGVVTFFGQCDARQAKQYLAALRRRGSVFLEGGGSSSVFPEGSVPASLSGVRNDKKSIGGIESPVNTTNNTNHDLQRGFTLLEAIIYMALLSLFIGGTLTSAYQLAQSAGHTQVATGTEAEGAFVLQKLTGVLSNMASATLPSAHEAILTAYDGDKTDISLRGSSVLIAENDALPMPLTTGSVTVTDLRFVLIPAQGDSPLGLAATTTINGLDFAITRYVRQ